MDRQRRAPRYVVRRAVGLVEVEEADEGERRRVGRRVAQVLRHAPLRHQRRVVGGVLAVRDHAVPGPQVVVEVLAVVLVDDVERIPARGVVADFAAWHLGAEGIEVLANEHRRVADGLELGPQRRARVEGHGDVAGDTGVYRVLPGQRVGSSRAAQGGLGNGLAERHALLREEPGQGRRPPFIVPEPAVVGVHIVEVEHDDVGRRPSSRDRRCLALGGAGRADHRGCEQGSRSQRDRPVADFIP